VSVLADYFLICSGTNTTQVKTLAEELEDKLAALGSNRGAPRARRQAHG
jgi:ribosome-associated protein